MGLHPRVKKIMKMLGQTDDQIKTYLVKEFNLSPGYAQNWLDAIAEEEEEKAETGVESSAAYA